MTLSILIPSVPSRRHRAAVLFDKLTKQAEGYSVEVLMLLDNKQRSIGKKREALVQISKGDWIAFVDDDDDVSEDYVSSIMQHATRNNLGKVIVFETLVTLDSLPGVICQHGMEFENEDYSRQGFKRKPWHMHAMPGSFARRCEFPDTNYGEDWPWCEMVLGYVYDQVKIDKVLYHYRFNSVLTEAK